MIAELGQYLLLLALIVAAVQAVVPMVGASLRNRPMMNIAAPAALVQFAAVGLAFLALIHGYVTSDFSLKNVFENSHSDKPLLYKITGVWGNHEGSMLLWAFILTLYGAAVAAFGRNLPPTLKARVLSVHGMIGVGFLAFIVQTSNPFIRLFPAPPDGQGLNPLLQDPGLASHPPFLYLGYVGFSMAFSFAVAALIEGRVDPAWARWVRPWTLVAWCALTLGICIGSWWAYYELGWGGWWAWDPVENASLMPWLSGTALLHSAIVVEKRDTLKTWTIFLALLTFALSLLGTFLVRSGVLSSVHSFASDPERGRFILALLAVTIGGSLLLYAVRAPSLRPTGTFAAVSREGFLILNNLLLATATFTVFLGTLYPLFLDTLGGGKVSVGAPFYNSTFMPLMVPLVIATGVGPMMTWKRADGSAVVKRLWLVFVLALAAAATTAFVAWGKSALAPLGLALAVWLFGTTVQEWAGRVRLFKAPWAETRNRMRHLPRSAWGMSLAHLGLAFTIAGITVSTGWKAEGIQTVRPGGSLVVAGETYRLDGTTSEQGPNYSALVAQVTVLGADGRVVTVMHPSRRTYPLQQQTLAKVAIHTNGFADRYVVMGEPQPNSGWILRVYYNPLVPWIWFGAVIMAAGGVLSLSDRRLRVGAPLRRTKTAAAGGEHVRA